MPSLGGKNPNGFTCLFIVFVGLWCHWTQLLIQSLKHRLKHSFVCIWIQTFIILPIDASINSGKDKSRSVWPYRITCVSASQRHYSNKMQVSTHSGSCVKNYPSEVTVLFWLNKLNNLQSHYMIKNARSRWKLHIYLYR